MLLLEVLLQICVTSQTASELLLLSVLLLHLQSQYPEPDLLGKLPGLLLVRIDRDEHTLEDLLPLFRRDAHLELVDVIKELVDSLNHLVRSQDTAWGVDLSVSEERKPGWVVQMVLNQLLDVDRVIDLLGVVRT